MTSAIISDIDNFVAQQNQNRGQKLAGGGTLSLDYDAVTGSVPAGGNAVTGIAGIAAGAAAITLPASQAGNAVIFDGAVSATASTSGTDSYSILVNTNGSVTVTDNNTGNSEAITGATYLIFDGGATVSGGGYQQAYMIETGVSAEMASMYNAAYGRVPDYAGLEFYIQQYGTAVLPNLHTMAGYFLSAPEFKAHWPSLQTTPDSGGPNDVAYIDALYGQILGRTPDATEIQFYVNALQGKLTDSHGNALAASDRADLLIYFSISAENQAKIAASNGGWLINPADGAQNFGAESQAAATAILSSDVSSGTINANDFSGMSSSTYAKQSNVLVAGANSSPDGVVLGINQIDVSLPNITINLNATYNFVWADGAGDIVNGYSGGGSQIDLSSVTVGGTAKTVNLQGNSNVLQLGIGVGSVSTPSTVNGWNSTDLFANLTNTGNFGPTDAVYVGSASNPVNGATIPNGTSIAVNLGSIAASSQAAEVAAIAAAADADYTIGGTITNVRSVYFFAQVGPDTLVYHWRGDSAHSGHVQAIDFDGAVDLVGIQASTLTAANFH